MLITTIEELEKAKARLKELQAILSHTEPGDYPDEEDECEELFDAIDYYYSNGGQDV